MCFGLGTAMPGFTTDYRQQKSKPTLNLRLDKYSNSCRKSGLSTKLNGLELETINRNRRRSASDWLNEAESWPVPPEFLVKQAGMSSHFPVLTSISCQIRACLLLRCSPRLEDDVLPEYSLLQCLHSFLPGWRVLGVN